MSAVTSTSLPTIVTIVGARPQFIKAAPLSRALDGRVREVLVHTGQHHDAQMSDVFFAELGLKVPHHHLGISGGTHGAQTGAMMAAIEDVLVRESPAAVLVYGDTNSTLAGALAAVKLHIPIAHVEAGLRSFNRRMPEEINRVLTDHMSSWLYTPAEGSRRQLSAEGITAGVHVVGDIMFDAVLHYRERAARSLVLDRLGLQPSDYYVCTIHRAENVDDLDCLRRLFTAIEGLPRRVVLPAHPRLRKQLAAAALQVGANVQLVDPLGYLDMLHLLRHSKVVLTDSGGLQKEAYYCDVRCVTLREETEWVETVAVGWNVLVGTDVPTIQRAVHDAEGARPAHPALYGAGDTAVRIAALLVQDLFAVRVEEVDSRGASCVA